MPEFEKLKLKNFPLIKNRETGKRTTSLVLYPLLTHSLTHSLIHCTFYFHKVKQSIGSLTALVTKRNYCHHQIAFISIIYKILQKLIIISWLRRPLKFHYMTHLMIGLFAHIPVLATMHLVANLEKIINL